MTIKKFRVVYSKTAYEDLNGIYDYIFFNLINPQAAKNVTTAIRNAVNSLDTFPERNKIIDDDPWKALKIRKENVKNTSFAIKWTIQVWFISSAFFIAAEILKRLE